VERDLSFASKKISARFILLCITLLSAVAGFSSITAPAHAADPVTKIFGVVTSSTEQPLAGVGISIVGPDGFSAEVESDSAGAWEVLVPTKGTYSATINEGDLPEGQALTDPTKGTAKANVFMPGVELRILFPIGPGVQQSSLLERSAQLTVDGLILGLIIA
jgi:hypothetical protein